MKTIRMLLLTILVTGTLTACRGVAAQQVMPGVVIVTMVPQPTPTPPVCTALPAGTSLVVEPVSASAARLSGEGFQPGEQLIVVLTSESPHHLHRIEDCPTDPVAADGCFTLTVHGLHPIPGATTNTWEVVLIHARGAACQTVALPADE